MKANLRRLEKEAERANRRANALGLRTEMDMTAAFSSYGRAVAVISACAFAVFFAQESQSQIALGAGTAIGSVAALMLWIRLRGTQYRFLVGVAAVIATTFLTFLLNNAYPGSALATVAAIVLNGSIYKHTARPPDLMFLVVLQRVSGSTDLMVRRH